MKKLRKTTLIGFICLILLLVPRAIAFGFAPVGASESVTVSYPDDEKALRGQADDYAKAFAAGDYTTIANMWSPDGTYTDAEGDEFKGRPAIEQFFKSSFEHYGGQPLEICIDSIKFPSTGVAIEEGRSRILQGRYAGSMSRYLVVHVKDNGKWQMRAVSETVCPESFNDSLDDLSWLIGKWTAKASSTKIVHARIDWTANQKFLRCVYQKEIAGDTKEMAVSIIGRNPSTGQIVSWHFDATGGYGSARWFRDGQSWVQHASSTEPTGATGNAIYVLSKLDNNNFTLRSTDRYLDHLPLPDTQEIKITREQ